MLEIFLRQNPWRTDPVYPFRFQKRDILEELMGNLGNPKILGLIGSRQVGKSSLLFLLIDHLLKSGIKSKNLFYFNLDDFALRPLFKDVMTFLHFIEEDSDPQERKYVLIDEIQHLDTPGLFLKELFDLKLNLKLVYSGSSQIEIRSKLREHLVGRAREFPIQRLSFKEYLRFTAPTTREHALNDFLIFGSYPEVALTALDKERKRILQDIHQSYIQKDVIDFLRVEDPAAFNKLLILLAHQVGALLNIQSLAKVLEIPRVLVKKYITMLENTFIIKLIYPFFKNYKKEITKSPKIYFLDLGLRNFMLGNFQALELREDQGKLFENFFFLDLLNRSSDGFSVINYWRTTNQTEVDFILGRGMEAEAIEVKWNKKTIPRSFATLKQYYPDMKLRVVTREDYLK